MYDFSEQVPKWKEQQEHKAPFVIQKHPSQGQLDRAWHIWTIPNKSSRWCWVIETTTGFEKIIGNIEIRFLFPWIFIKFFPLVWKKLPFCSSVNSYYKNFHEPEDELSKECGRACSHTQTNKHTFTQTHGHTHRAHVKDTNEWKAVIR